VVAFAKLKIKILKKKKNIFIINMPKDLCDNKRNKVLSSKKYKNSYPIDVTIYIVKHW
jgi:hypothetical protein